MTIYENIKTLIPEQYRTADNFNKILQILSEPFEDLKIVFSDIKGLLDLDIIFGSQLDLIGDIVGEKRNGRVDVDYLNGIKFKIFKNTSKGFIDDIIKALKFLTNATIVVYSDNPPASYTVYTNGQTLPADIHYLIDKLSAAGVSLIIYASDGEVPMIMTEVNTIQANLQDDIGNNIVDDLSDQIVVNYQNDGDTFLRDIFQGDKLGVIRNDFLTTNLGDNIVDDAGNFLVVANPNQELVESGKLNLVYQ